MQGTHFFLVISISLSETSLCLSNSLRSLWRLFASLRWVRSGKGLCDGEGDSPQNVRGCFRHGISQASSKVALSEVGCGRGMRRERIIVVQNDLLKLCVPRCRRPRPACASVYEAHGGSTGDRQQFIRSKGGLMSCMRRTARSIT